MCWTISCRDLGKKPRGDQSPPVRAALELRLSYHHGNVKLNRRVNPVANAVVEHRHAAVKYRQVSPISTTLACVCTTWTSLHQIFSVFLFSFFFPESSSGPGGC